MALRQLIENPDIRHKVNAEILERFGTYDKWWEWQQQTLGQMMIGSMLESTPEQLTCAFDPVQTESPIERKFLIAATGVIKGIEIQYTIGFYRVDFAIPRVKIAIELDGHDFHSTVEQRTNDARRARTIEAAGWRVLRFTGSEINADVGACVEEVLAIVEVLES